MNLDIIRSTFKFGLFVANLSSSPDTYADVLSKLNRVYELKEIDDGIMIEREALVDALKSGLNANMMTPIQLLSIRNYIVSALRHTQLTYIDKLIIKFSLWTTSEQNVWKNGNQYSSDMQRFRHWLDSAIKLTNVPNRRQASNWLEEPSVTTEFTIHTVARLFCIQTIGHVMFERVFYLDKVGKGMTKPIRIPLGETLSIYMGWFLSMKKYRTQYVFDILNSVWDSSKICDYLRELTQLSDKCLPNQHILRTIQINALGVCEGMDRYKMGMYAILCRHELDVVQRSYSKWYKQFQMNEYDDVRFRYKHIHSPK